MTMLCSSLGSFVHLNTSHVELGLIVVMLQPVWDLWISKCLYLACDNVISFSSSWDYMAQADLPRVVDGKKTTSKRTEHL